MDGVDALLAEQLRKRFPRIHEHTLPANDNSTIIWEPT
jgi:hypothetical protein